MPHRSKHRPLNKKQRDDLFNGLEILDALAPHLSRQGSAGTSEYITLADFDDQSTGWIMVSVSSIIDSTSIAVTVEDYMVELSEVNKGRSFKHARMILRDAEMFSACKGGMPRTIGTQIIITRYKPKPEDNYVASVATTPSVKDVMGTA